MLRVSLVLDNIENIDFDKLRNIIERLFTYQKIANEFEKDDMSNAIDILLLLNIESSYHLDDVLGKIYSNVREVLMDKNLALLPVNVLLGNFDRDRICWDYVFATNSTVVEEYNISYKQLEFIDSVGFPKDLNLKREADIIATRSESRDTIDRNLYDVSAVGGTFDHIHDGHKILLTVTAFVTEKRLIVGLTDQKLLINKKFKELLQDFHIRETNLIEFLNLLKPTLDIQCIPLNDVCGPTGTVPEIKCLVVSRETIAGGEIVNKTRVEKGMHPLVIKIVNVLGGEAADGWKEKLSSTELRRLLTERAREKISNKK